jgi:hypothetical protein
MYSKELQGSLAENSIIIKTTHVATNCPCFLRQSPPPYLLKIKITKSMTYTYCLGGVGIILALIASFTDDCRGSVSPSSGGDSIVSAMCPCAMPSQLAAVRADAMLTAIHPDHGQSSSEKVSAISKY